MMVRDVFERYKRMSPEVYSLRPSMIVGTGRGG